MALGHFRDMMIDVAIHLECNQKREAKAAIHEDAPRSAGEAASGSVLDYDAAATPRRLQVGAGVGVDFHADSDLDDARCFPSHDVSP
jgi:hypothetical protein